MEQIEFPKFIEFPVIFDVTENKSEERKYAYSKVKVNPTQVVCFYPIHRNINGDEKSLTSATIGALQFWIDMSYDEFDEFWSETKRSFQINEPLY